MCGATVATQAPKRRDSEAARTAQAPECRDRRDGKGGKSSNGNEDSKTAEATMADVPVERRFLGTVRLVTLHLWRVAHSTDLDEGFAAARAMGMISDEHEQFMRTCLAASDDMEAGRETPIPITTDVVNELQQCALRLNSADPA